jgi:hypothetical protein
LANIGVRFEISSNFGSSILSPHRPARACSSCRGRPAQHRTIRRQIPDDADDVAHAAQPVAVGLVARLIAANREESAVADEAGQLLKDARAGKGTVGKLLTDDSLYAELNGLARDARLAVGKVDDQSKKVDQFVNDGRETLRSVKQGTDAVQRLPIIRSYVEDHAAVMVRPEPVAAPENVGHLIHGHLDVRGRARADHQEDLLRGLLPPEDGGRGDGDQDQRVADAAPAFYRDLLHAHEPTRRAVFGKNCWFVIAILRYGEVALYRLGDRAHEWTARTLDWPRAFIRMPRPVE